MRFASLNQGSLRCIWFLQTSMQTLSLQTLANLEVGKLFFLLADQSSKKVCRQFKFCFVWSSGMLAFWKCLSLHVVNCFTLLIVYFHLYSFGPYELNYPCIIFKIFYTPQLCLGNFRNLGRESNIFRFLTEVVLRSEIPSGMCAKLRTVAASNNRDLPTMSLSSSPFASTINCSPGSQALLEVTHQDHSIRITLRVRYCYVQSFTALVSPEITRHDHSIIACSRHVHIFLFFAHIPIVVNHTINATPPERPQQ